MGSKRVQAHRQAERLHSTRPFLPAHHLTVTVCAERHDRKAQDTLIRAIRVAIRWGCRTSGGAPGGMPAMCCGMPAMCCAPAQYCCAPAHCCA